MMFHNSQRHPSSDSSTAKDDGSSSRRAHVILYSEGSSDDQRFDINAPHELGHGPPRPVRTVPTGGAAPADVVIVAPIDPVNTAIAVLAVLASQPAAVSQNRVPLEPGFHLLQHGDRIEVGGTIYWIAAPSTVRHARYDPATHGAGATCLLTKARLRPGDPIVLCPGLPGISCGAIYRADSWDMAMQSEPPMPCAHCGYHSQLAAWTPPPRRHESSLSDALESLLQELPQ